MRTNHRGLVALACLFALLAAACGSDEPTSASSPAATAESSPTATPLEPIGEADTDRKGTDDFPIGDTEVALLTDVRASAHEGFDRVVFTFDVEEAPTWRVEYAEEPVNDTSGEQVTVRGEATLVVGLAPAAGVDLSGDEPEPTYTGSKRFTPSGTSAVVELALVEDFEANLSWIIGVDGRRPFAAEFLADPVRLVIDVMAS